MTETREVTGVMRSLKHAQGDPLADESSDDEITERHDDTCGLPLQQTAEQNQRSTRIEPAEVTQWTSNHLLVPPQQKTRAQNKRLVNRALDEATTSTSYDLIPPQVAPKRYAQTYSSTNNVSDDDSDDLYVPSPSSHKRDSPKSPKHNVRVLKQRVPWSTAALSTIRKVFCNTH